MEILSVLMAGLTGIILFIFGLESLSQEVERITGERFRRSLAKATSLPVIGVIIGALVTAAIQSSSATSVITIGLVNAGVLSFKNSIGIIFGSNIGTTITAQLVAFKLTAFAPAIIIFGFLLSLLRSKAAVFGKVIFYFGFVFFTLNLIASSLQPLQDNAAFMALLAQPHNPFVAILVGCVVTALIQSSAVTTGLAIILTQQGVLGLENAVPLMMGANLGTTSTAMIAMFNMDIAAKKTAFSHFLFNFGGVLIFLPFLFFYSDDLALINREPGVALALVHLVFNVVTTIIFIIFINPFTRLVDYLLGAGKMDFERLPIPSVADEKPFTEIRTELEQQAHALLIFLQENYSQVTLSLETNYKGVFESAEKRIDYTNFLQKEYIRYFSQVVAHVNERQETSELMRLINRFDYLFQIHDSIEDLYNTKKVVSSHYVELRSDVLLIVRELSSQTLALFDEISHSEAGHEKVPMSEMSMDLQQHIDNCHRQMLALLSDPERADAGALTNFITYSQRLKDKLINYYKLNERIFFS